MAITNYTELQTAVSDWLHRGNLTAQIPDFIDIGENHINNDLRVRSMIDTVNIVPSTTVRYVDLPERYHEIISFNDDFGDQMQQVNPNQLEIIRYAAGTFRPEFFSITNRINFERIADQAYNFPFTYYKKLDISTDNTNQVLTDYPDIYLYAALIVAEPYILNDQRSGTWNQLYQAAVKKANSREQKSTKTLRSDHPSARTPFNIFRGF